MNTTKKSIVFWSLAAAALFVTATDDASAQSATGTVSASATVLAYLDVTKVDDVAFGQINPGSGAALTPGGAVGAGQSLGVLKVDHNSDVIVSASVPSVLTLAGAPDLPVSFACGYSTASSGSLDGAQSACNALANRVGNGDGSTKTSYIQIGGSVLAADTSSRMPGTYTGSLVFTITATY
jgi:hypothetical protein